jgi:transposase-like protein
MGYSDGLTSYDMLDVSEFHHHRINHSQAFVEGKTNYINGIENFGNQAISGTCAASTAFPKTNSRCS